MAELFPFSSLTAKQTVIVSELLRVHPQGRVENDSGRPVFVSDLNGSSVRISLSEHHPGGEHDRQPGGQLRADRS